MRNSEMVCIYLPRLEVCDLLIATIGITIAEKMEASDENTSDDRRRICEASAGKWRRLHDKIKRQLDAFDIAYDSKEVQND